MFLQTRLAAMIEQPFAVRCSRVDSLVIATMGSFRRDDGGAQPLRSAVNGSTPLRVGGSTGSSRFVASVLGVEMRSCRIASTRSSAGCYGLHCCTRAGIRALADGTGRRRGSRRPVRVGPASRRQSLRRAVRAWPCGRTTCRGHNRETGRPRHASKRRRDRSSDEAEVEPSPRPRGRRVPCSTRRSTGCEASRSRESRYAGYRPARAATPTLLRATTWRGDLTAAVALPIGTRVDHERTRHRAPRPTVRDSPPRPSPRARP